MGKVQATLSVRVLNKLAARAAHVERARDRAIEREDYERADDWHSHATRLLNAVTYLESRVARVSSSCERQTVRP